eukprot:GFUD01035008.1.p1 GENE.GFUD01035008.1~~GFUD01035008.1.p1  ORF type:complete len:232 (+),score=75.10 GFUD01035008.1:112-807(+)
MPGFWRRPIARVYSYNLDLGENYYSPMKDYLGRDRVERGETPGALTHSERIARRWCEGDKDRQLRAKTEAYERDAMREAIRATSEVRREVTPRVEQKVDYSAIDSATQKAEAVMNTHRRMIRDISEDTQRRVQEINPRYEDNISKRMADIRLSPWRGQEMDTEYRTSQEARGRIQGLERELEEITRKAMTYRSYHKTAKELAAEALRDDALMSSSTKRTKRVTYESNRRLM